jgi:hypothetical protein
MQIQCDFFWTENEILSYINFKLRKRGHSKRKQRKSLLYWSTAVIRTMQRYCICINRRRSLGLSPTDGQTDCTCVLTYTWLSMQRWQIWSAELYNSICLPSQLTQSNRALLIVRISGLFNDALSTSNWIKRHVIWCPENNDLERMWKVAVEE